MKLLLKILTGIILVILLLAVGAIVAVKAFAPSAIASFVKNQSGATVSWSRFDIQPLGGNLYINDFILNNPSNYETELMLSIPELRIDTDLNSFKAEPYKVNDLTLHLAKLNMVRDAQGQMNFKQLQEKFAPAQEHKDEPVADTPKEAQQQAPEIFFGHIKLQIDTFQMIDHSTTPARTTTVPVNFLIEEENITLVELQQKIVNQVMPIVLRQLGPVMAKEALGSALGLSNKAADAASDTLKSGAKAASDSLDAAAKGAKEATESLKNAAKGLKGLFGN